MFGHFELFITRFNYPVRTHLVLICLKQISTQNGNRSPNLTGKLLKERELLRGRKAELERMLEGRTMSFRDNQSTLVIVKKGLFPFLSLRFVWLVTLISLMILVVSSYHWSLPGFIVDSSFPPEVEMYFLLLVSKPHRFLSMALLGVLQLLPKLPQR